MVQANVVPETLLDRAIEVGEPEHNDWEVGDGVTTGIGFTVTVILTGVPLQPLAVGVTEYTTVPGVLPEAVSV